MQHYANSVDPDEMQHYANSVDPNEMQHYANSVDPDEMQHYANSVDHDEMQNYANSVDPDEMQYYAAFHLGLHCLQKYSFRVSRIQRVLLVLCICCRLKEDSLSRRWDLMIRVYLVKTVIFSLLVPEER